MAPVAAAAPPPAAAAAQPVGAGASGVDAVASLDAVPAKAIPQPPAPAIDPSSRWAQIGAFASEGNARQAWLSLTRDMPAQTAGRSERIVAVTHRGALLYHALVGPFADRAGAGAFCATLAAPGQTAYRLSA